MIIVYALVFLASGVWCLRCSWRALNRIDPDKPITMNIQVDQMICVATGVAGVVAGGLGVRLLFSWITG